MKPNLRWQLLLVLAGFFLVLVLLSLRPAVPAAPPAPVVLQEAEPFELADPTCAATPAPLGGYLVEGMVGRPQFINPLLADDKPVDRRLSGLIFDGLTRLDSRGQVQPALAESWTIGEDNLSVTFFLRADAAWHDGRPVTADDVLLTVALLQDEAINSRLVDGPLWGSVTVEKIDDRQVRFTLPAPYAPFLEAAGRGLLPAHLLAGVAAADLGSHPFNGRPVGSGPFAVQNSWADDGVLVLQAQPGRWGSPPILDGLQVRFYPDEAALLGAFAQGEINAAALPTSMVPEILALPGSRVFTGLQPVYTQLLFNLSESGSPGIRDLAVRQALAAGLDRQSLIDEVFSGQGVLFEGPFLPDTWAFDPTLPRAYPYDPAAAAVQLDAAGWVDPDGGDGPAPRQKVDGEQPVPLTAVLLASDDETSAGMARAAAAQWAELGLSIDLQIVDAATLRTRLSERAFDIAVVDIQVPRDPDLYDFWSQEAIVRGQNYAGWNHRRASEALEAGRQVWRQEDRRQFYQAFLTFFDQGLPALTVAQHVNNFGVNDTIQGVNIGLIQQEQDRYRSFNRWAFRPDADDAGCAPAGS